jgi:hypothetical protein
MKPRRRTQKREEQRQWRKQAIAARAEHNLCRCPDGDDVRTYDSTEECRADDSPYLTCETCGLGRLRIKAVRDPGYGPLEQQLERMR